MVAISLGVCLFINPLQMLKTSSHVDGRIGKVEVHTRFTKLYTKLLSLPDNAKETFVAQLKETLHPLQGSTPSLTTSTHKTGENFTYRFVLGPLQSLSTDQNTHLTSKTAFWLCWLSRKIRHTPTQTDQNWAQFLIAQHTPYKTRYAFSQARDLFPQTYSVIAARIELSYTYIKGSHCCDERSHKINVCV